MAHGNTQKFAFSLICIAALAFAGCGMLDGSSGNYEKVDSFVIAAKYQSNPYEIREKYLGKKIETQMFVEKFIDEGSIARVIDANSGFYCRMKGTEYGQHNKRGIIVVRGTLAENSGGIGLDNCTFVSYDANWTVESQSKASGDSSPVTGPTPAPTPAPAPSTPTADSTPQPTPQPAPQVATPATDNTPFAPSFDCTKASNNIEKLICSDRELAKLDVELSQHYAEAKAKAADKSKLKSDQIAWVKSSRECSDKPCLIKSFGNRIAELSK